MRGWGDSQLDPGRIWRPEVGSEHGAISVLLVLLGLREAGHTAGKMDKKDIWALPSLSFCE